jgi:glucose/mannose-6-phosphate isomerase
LAIIKPLQVAVHDVTELGSIGEWLRGEVAAFAPEVPVADNYAKQLALKLVGKTTITYAGPLLFPAANKWKICMNENAKNTAWTNQYPEFNHNEFIGWSSHPVEKPFAVVEIRSNLEHPRVQKRFEVSERLLSGMRPAPIVVVPKGETLLQQLAYTFALADFVSIYVAILNGVDPTPVDLVEKLKKELG